MCRMEINKHNSEKEREWKGQNNVCRLCMSKNVNVPIFPDKNELKSNKEPPLVCKIMASVNIQVKKDDGLPTNICNDCVSKVESAYEFLRLCEMSDSFLRRHLDFGVPFTDAFYSELLRIIGEMQERT